MPSVATWNAVCWEIGGDISRLLYPLESERAMQDEHDYPTGLPASGTVPSPSTDSLLARIADLKERYEQHLARARATARLAQDLFREAHGELDELHRLQAIQEATDAEQAEQAE